MPPRGVKKGSKRARQYEHVKQSEKEQGRAEEIAARTVNKERARSGTDRPRAGPRDQLYNDARKLNIEGRSKMNEDQLQRAVAGASG